MPEHGAVWRVREAMDTWLHKSLPADFDQLRTDMEHILSCMPAPDRPPHVDGHFIIVEPDIHPGGRILGYTYWCDLCSCSSRFGWRIDNLKDHENAIRGIREHQKETHTTDNGWHVTTHTEDFGATVGYRYTCSKCPWGWRTTQPDDHNHVTTRMRNHHTEEHPVNPEPQDPFTVMAAGAMSIHEMYAALLAAGFTGEQALYLTAQFATGGKGTPPPPPVAAP